MQRRHELPLRLERDRVEPGVVLAQPSVAQAELARRDEERPFGRVARHAPEVVLVLESRVVTECPGDEQLPDLAGQLGGVPLCVR